MYILSAVAGVLFIIGFVPYIYSILRKETKPSKVSWIIWGSLETITLAGMYAEHAVNGQIIGSALGNWVIVILAIKYGTSGWTKLDKFCLSGAVLGITLWMLFNNPTFGIMICLGIIALGAVPTITSAWKNPSHEDKPAWTIFWISCVCAIIAIPQWTLADAAQPIVFFVIDTIMMYVLYIHKTIQEGVLP